jgi:hypothetical protein
VTVYSKKKAKLGVIDATLRGYDLYSSTRYHGMERIIYHSLPFSYRNMICAMRWHGGKMDQPIKISLKIALRLIEYNRLYPTEAELESLEDE